MSELFELLKKLCLTDAVSGNECGVRHVIENEIKGYCAFRTDPLGNLIVEKKGNKTPVKKVMLAAHMDEVGLIITGITDQGYLRFAPVGGIDPRVLYGTVVTVSGKVNGVVGGKAVHHLSASETEKAPGFDEMLIDIGAFNKEDASQYVKPGDFAAFHSDFYSFGDDYIKGKALDDRIGCALMIQLLKTELEYDTSFCFNVQEEIGLRGSRVSAFSVAPDIALVLEATTAADLNGVEGDKRVCVLGQGPVVSFMDSHTIYDRALFHLAFETAQEMQIPCQTKTAIAGGNDAGAIHLSGSGVRTLAISLPCRYIHTPSCVVMKKDIEATEKLISALLDKLYDPAC